MSTNAVFAAEDPYSKFEVYKSCKLDDLIKKDGYFQLKKDKIESGKAQKDVDKEVADSKKAKKQDEIYLVVRIAFENARTKYHDAIKCIFDQSTSKIFNSVDGLSDETDYDTQIAHTTNWANWLTPARACIKQDDIKKILKTTSPGELIGPIMETYNQYTAFIKYLDSIAAANPSIDSSTIDNFAALFARYKILKLIMEDELQNAIVALDTAFIALKELRQAILLHIHFQCMLRNLENYRRVMANLRSVVDVLPPLIIDASMHK